MFVTSVMFVTLYVMSVCVQVKRSHECYVCLYVMSVRVQVTRFLFKSQAYGFGSSLLLYI